MSGEEPSQEQMNAALSKYQQEMQAQLMGQMSQTMMTLCFDKCAGKSGKRLDTKEQNCLASCMDRFVDTMNQVGQAMNDRGNMN